MPAATIRWGTTPRQRTVVGHGRDARRVKSRRPKLDAAGADDHRAGRRAARDDELVRAPPAVRPDGRRHPHAPAGERPVGAARRNSAPTSSKPRRSSSPRPASGPASTRRSAASATYDWVVFTSANGVAFTKQRLAEHRPRRPRLRQREDRRHRRRDRPRGPRAAVPQRRPLPRQLRRRGPRRRAGGAAAHVKGGRFLLLRADIARPVLRERLQRDGAAEVQRRRHLRNPPGRVAPASPCSTRWTPAR